MLTLPIFPLKMVVFPNEKINLHIFEHRYRQLVHECWESGGSFCIPFFNNSQLMPIVAEVKLLEISKTYTDGKMDIKTRATETVFSIKQVKKTLPDKLYSAALVEELPYIYDDKDLLLAFEIQQQIFELYEVLEIERAVPPAETLLMFDVAHYLGLTRQQEFDLLTLRSEIERQTYVNEHLLAYIPTTKEMHALQRKAKLNGHFKHLQPPDFIV